MPAQRNPSAPPIKIVGELTIYTVAAHAASLFAEASDATALSLDLSEVGELDTAGVQLLLLLQRELHAAGVTLHLTSISAAVAEVFALLNLTSRFSITAPAAAGGGQP